VTEPFLSDPDLTLYCGDALAVLRELPAESVHMAMTSPPFFGLRDYGVEGQLGLEASPDEWTARLVEVFREVRRVLRSDGTCWVEIGDSYAANYRGSEKPSAITKGGVSGSIPNSWGGGQATPVRHPTKPKDLLGQPFLLAFALRDDGWYWRGCYVWHRPNPMPESVRDRFTTSHSYVLHLAKRSRYFFDAEAVKEPAEWARWGDQTVPKHEGTATASGWIPARAKEALTGGRQRAVDGRYAEAGFKTTDERNARYQGPDPAPGFRNRRSVLTIPTEPNGLAICAVCDAYWELGAPREHCEKPVIQHFAAFPAKLVEIPILAGTSEHGVCAECGAPWVREVETIKRYIISEGGSHQDGTYRVRYADGAHTVGFREISDQDARNYSQQRWHTQSSTLGWSPSCTCDAGVRPAVVLDPFAGSGTTLLVARRLGRHAVGIELNRDYCRMQRERLRQLSLLAEVSP
jgi:DNA modification methylase